MTTQITKTKTFAELLLESEKEFQKEEKEAESLPIKERLEFKIVKYHEWRTKNKKKPITDLARWVRRLIRLSNNDPENAIEILNVAREN